MPIETHRPFPIKNPLLDEWCDRRNYDTAVSRRCTSGPGGFGVKSTGVASDDAREKFDMNPHQWRSMYYRVCYIPL